MCSWMLKQTETWSYLSEVFEYVIDDNFLGFIRVDSSERIHINYCILKLDQWDSQSSL